MELDLYPGKVKYRESKQRNKLFCTRSHIIKKAQGYLGTVYSFICADSCFELILYVTTRVLLLLSNKDRQHVACESPGQNKSHVMDSEGSVEMRLARDVKHVSRALFIKLHNCISLAFCESHNVNYKGNVDYCTVCSAVYFNSEFMTGDQTL